MDREDYGSKAFRLNRTPLKKEETRLISQTYKT